MPGSTWHFGNICQINIWMHQAWSVLGKWPPLTTICIRSEGPPQDFSLWDSYKKPLPREPILNQAHVIYQKYLEFFPSQTYFRLPVALGLKSNFLSQFFLALQRSGANSPVSLSSLPFEVTLSHPARQLLPPTGRGRHWRILSVFSCWERTYQGGTDCPV